MKSFVATLAIGTLALIGAAPLAEARHGGCPPSRTYISGYASCGTPIYTERYFIRYTRRGDIVWGYRTLPIRRAYRPAPRRYVERCEYDAPRYHRPSGGITISGTIFR